MISDTTLYAFLEELKQDKELIVSILFNSVNEVVVFFSYMIIMLKRLHPMAHSFTSTMQMIKELTRQINDEYGDTLPTFLTSPQIAQLQKDFNKFFQRHLLKNYCSIIREQPGKRASVCELLYAHT